LVQHPLTRFAEFIIGRRFAPTRWQIDLSPLGRGEPKQTDSIQNHLALEKTGTFRHHDGGRAKSAAIPRRFASRKTNSWF
jgi:hypothetical protein